MSQQDKTRIWCTDGEYISNHIDATEEDIEEGRIFLVVEKLYADNLEAQLKAKDEVIQGLIEALEQIKSHKMHPMLTGIEHDADAGRTAKRLATEAIEWAKEKMNTNTKEKK